MKNVKKAIALVAIIFGVSMSSFAQNGLSVRVGGNFPMGAFAEGGSLSDIALIEPGSTLGGAATGFNAGLKYQFGVLGNLSAFASADLFYNGLKGNLKNDIKQFNEDHSIPSYLNLPVMVGANYTILNILGTTLWAEAGIGVNFRNITGEPINLTSLIDDDASYEMSTTFAWQAGVGVSLSKKVSLGLHYYAFGNSEVDVDDDFSDIKEEILGGIKDSKLNPSMIVIRLGYHF